MNCLCDFKIRNKNRKVSLKEFISMFIFNPAFRVIYLFRLFQKYHHKPILGKLIKIIYILQSNKFSIQLGDFTNIGEGLLLPHNGPIIINSSAKIGAMCIIHPNVLVGGNRIHDGWPTIGDRVFIGNGAKIIGSINIGDNVFISPAAFITKDVPSDSVVGAGINNILKTSGGSNYVKLYQ